VRFDDALAGKYPVTGMCPHCGHVADNAWRSMKLASRATRRCHLKRAIKSVDLGLDMCGLETCQKREHHEN
jgi:hypothetical protein